jgi:hypothetical protein
LGITVTGDCESIVAALGIVATPLCSKMPLKQADDTRKKLLMLQARP